MLRDASLVPLSRQHQHALALCVRIRRALETAGSPTGVWNTEISKVFADEIAVHFAAEEALVFPEAEKFSALEPLVEHLLKEHAALRDSFQLAEAGKLDAKALLDFATRLDDHLRKEERGLFEQMQLLVPAERLRSMGSALERFLMERGAGPSCGLTP